MKVWHNVDANINLTPNGTNGRNENDKEHN